MFTTACATVPSLRIRLSCTRLVERFHTQDAFDHALHEVLGHIRLSVHHTLEYIAHVPVAAHVREVHTRESPTGDLLHETQVLAQGGVEHFSQREAFTTIPLAFESSIVANHVMNTWAALKNISQKLPS